MYLLSTLAAGFVRGIYIDRLDKLSEGIGRQFREGTVPLYPLNKLPYILCLLFMFMDLLLQTFDLGFEVFLFLGVVFAHHGESFIIQPTGNIVLVNADEKTYPMLSLNFVWVTLAAKVFWREHVAAHHWLGVGFIIIGIIVLGGSL